MTTNKLKHFRLFILRHYGEYIFNARPFKILNKSYMVIEFIDDSVSWFNCNTNKDYKRIYSNIGLYIKNMTVYAAIQSEIL